MQFGIAPRVEGRSKFPVWTVTCARVLGHTSAYRRHSIVVGALCIYSSPRHSSSKLRIPVKFDSLGLFHHTIGTWQIIQELQLTTLSRNQHPREQSHPQHVPHPTRTRCPTRSFCSSSNPQFPLRFHDSHTICTERRTRQRFAQATIDRVRQIWFRRRRSTHKRGF